MTRLLHLKGVALVRGGRLLIDQLDLTVREGEAVHVTGINGSGKSSLLRLIAGLLQPVEGSIEQSPAALADDLSALDRELPLCRALDFWTARDSGEALARFGLVHLAHIPVRLLSTGQLKRATLARVAASGAPLWLLDEPFNALDRDGTARLEQAIADHRERGGAVIAASHLAPAGTWRELGL
ncbi:MAG TPA: heme ABC exporter ATP-binding protein CcmA [Sphingomicrobium sp.]|nr:heme ABC exporter ATP-binding protein CcmA [Sphingomicrobium sp.]